MNSTDPGNASPQFETVEYASTSGNCTLCNQPLPSTYYRVNGEQACANCIQKEQVAQKMASSHYGKALIFGIGAAIVGLIGYATFAIVTGWVIGYLSLGVGWLIGKAMLKGSNGIGGRRYQVTAALLTYAAVSMAAIPVWVSHVKKEDKTPAAQVQVQPPPARASDGATAAASPALSPSTAFPEDVSQAAADKAAANKKDDSATLPSQPVSKPVAKPATGVAAALGMVALIGLASPFLELASPFHGLIGLFILFIGIRIAWTMTARPKLVIDGPF